MAKKNYLNSTGTCRVIDGEYFSYYQQMTMTYKGRRLFDNGFWSMTTRKHQSIIRSYIGYNTIDLKYADFNHAGAEYSIKKEIANLEYEVEQRLTKRKTQKNIDTIEQLNRKINMLQDLLKE